MKALLIGDKSDFDQTLINNIQEIGIGHLFVVSGLHMNILLLIISRILSLIKVKKPFFFILSFFIIYYFISGFLISIIRVILVYLLTYLNKKYRLNLTNLDIYMISIILILIVNPNILTNYAFLLTYTISVSLVITNRLLLKKGKFKFIINSLIMSINCILVTLPIVANLNPTINLLTILFNMIYIPIVSYLLLPISIIVTFLPFLQIIYAFLINIFSFCTINLASLNFGRITFPYLSSILIIVYYWLYFNIISSFFTKIKFKKLLIKLSCYLLFVIGWSYKQYLNPNDEIIFLDLPVGEATLVIQNHHQLNILIDTGENTGEEIEVFLKRKGIKTLHYVIISHGDSDHNGKLPLLMQQFKIENIILSSYDQSTKNLINKESKINKFFFKKGSKLKTNNFKLECLSPTSNDPITNNNSLVLLLEIFNFRMLLTGDIEKKIEQSLVNEFKDLNVNLLKVPHHGSLTSSSDNLIKNIKFKEVVCMSGYRNIYNFPNGLIKSRYQKIIDNSHIYFTDDYGTIIFKKKWYQSAFKVLFTLPN